MVHRAIEAYDSWWAPTVPLLLVLTPGLSEFGSGLLDEISSEDDGSSPVERVMFERSLLLGVCVELWRMRSRLRLILSEIRRTWEVGGRGEDGMEFMSSGVAR
ncbi:hypothetical protein DY000_02046146 [Brassica cretica]|uniref:Uncharacterized protein n=1 Tax=Brassica cretica TaxID=69181 RepID=A0ABQ7ERG5_BRACR|nr:hypothetical protein DY000_02046146 [Brassica cretica]